MTGRTFVLQSSLATGVISLRTTLIPLILGVVSGTTQVGLFRIAQTPQTGLAAASSPARLMLMTEQTRDWEKGERRSILAGIRSYTKWAGALMLGTTGGGSAVFEGKLDEMAIYDHALSEERIAAHYQAAGAK